jgi:hypothetical protein
VNIHCQHRSYHYNCSHFLTHSSASNVSCFLLPLIVFKISLLNTDFSQTYAFWTQFYFKITELTYVTKSATPFNDEESDYFYSSSRFITETKSKRTMWRQFY